MKTIKQIAGEIGVSKQAIFYRIKKQPLSNKLQPLMKNIDGALMIDVDGETLIKREFAKNTAKEFYDKHPSNSTNDDERFDGQFISLLQDTINVLREQLAVKDKQLEERDKQLVELTTAVRLHAEGVSADRKNELAGTIFDGQKQLTDGSHDKEEPRGIFRHLFRKNK